MAATGFWGSTDYHRITNGNKYTNRNEQRSIWSNKRKHYANSAPVAVNELR